MKKFLSFLFILCLFLPFGYGYALKKISSYLVEQLEMIQKNLSDREIALTYTLENKNTCLFRVCLTLNNVSASWKNETLFLGSVNLQFAPLPVPTLHIENIPGTATNFLTFKGKISNNVLLLERAFLSWGILEATLSGTIDFDTRQTDLSGNARNLKKFVDGFLKKEMRGWTSWFFKNTSQQITVQTLNNWIQINGFPVFSIQ